MIVDFSYYVGIMQAWSQLDWPVVRVPTPQEGTAMRRQIPVATNKEPQKCL